MSISTEVKTLSKAIPESVRLHNRSVILQLLYPDHEFTRADLARACGLTRVAVSDIISDLLAQGLVKEVGSSRNDGPGKRGKLLKIEPDSRSIIVLDLSTPYVFRGAVMNLLGQISARQELALGSDCRVSTQLVGQLCDLLLPAAQAPILGLGLATPGIVSAEGVVDDATNLGWEQVDFRSYLAQRTCLSPSLISVENDANSDVLAEQQFGSGGPNLMLVHIAQGIGAGLMVSGQLVRGRNRAAGEIGHIVVDRQGKRCPCGKRGCLETIITIPILGDQLDRQPNQSEQILSRAGHFLGCALSLPVGVLDLPEVSILGQARIVNQTFIAAVSQSLNESVATQFRQPVKVSRSYLGEDAALLGACAKVVRRQLYSDTSLD